MTKKPNESAKESLVLKIREQLEELLAADNVTESQKEELIRQALKIIEDGKRGVTQ